MPRLPSANSRSTSLAAASRSSSLQSSASASSAAATGSGEQNRRAVSRRARGFISTLLCADFDPSKGLLLPPDELARLVEVEQGEQGDGLGHPVGALHGIVERKALARCEQVAQ